MKNSNFTNKIYYATLSTLIRPFRYTMERSIVIANSKFTMSRVLSYLKLKSYVVYPPVNVTPYLSLACINDHKEDIVVTVGRFSPIKNYEAILKVAQKLPEITFYIIGGTNSKRSLQYYNKIKRLSDGIDNLKLLSNCDLNDKISILQRAKIYLHAMINEHFGISIVEAMAAGLVPIVHKSGGPWLDILASQNGKYGFSYRSLNEAVKLINNLVTNNVLLQKISKKAVERAKFFSADKYRVRFRKIINSIIGKH